MSYHLGIDFGTTFTAAAVRRAGATDGPEVVPLGGPGGTVSSALHLARNGRVTVGEAAAGLAGIDPTRVVRALKRRVGDPTPVVVGGQPWVAEELSARLLRWVVDRVVEHEGAPPARIALAHPLSWAAQTLDRLGTALAGHDLDVTFVAEPHAVAHVAAGATAPGDTVAVHDLGGGRFDATVLRREGPPASGFAVLGVPGTISDLGGLDLDELVWQHLRTGLPGEVSPVARVRRACNRAKEALSVEAEVVVRIRRDEFRGAIHLDRPTFEGLIAPQVDRTVGVLRRAIASAGLEPERLAALLLVGGSARIPLVARTVTEQLGRVPTVQADPDLVARGAVLALPYAAADSANVPTVTLAAPAGMDAPATSSGALAAVPATPPDAAAPARRRSRVAAVLDPGRGRTRRRSLPRTLVGVGAVIVAALVLVALFRPDGPLDPPLDPVAGDGASRPPAAVAPATGAAVPTAAEIAAEPPVGVPMVPARRAGLRPSVTTTPPAVPPATRSVRTGAPPTGLTPPRPAV